MDELTFQLIFSDGGETAEEHLWKLYPVAMLPFAWGLDPKQVFLFVNPALLQHLSDPVKRGGVYRFPLGDRWYPAAYSDYFWSILEHAVGVDALATTDENDRPTLKFPDDGQVFDFRFISGHGFNDFQFGGQLRFTKMALHFENLGPLPRVLTILDVGASPQAAAVFSGNYPRGDPRAFNWKKAFTNPTNPIVPLVCDKSNSTWAFRVGYEGQPDDDCNENYIGMTAPFGGAVSFCLLLALKTFVDDGYAEPSLNLRFEKAYKALKTGFLRPGTNSPKPYADLDGLQEFFVNNKLSLNMEVFDCQTFQLSHKWYLTQERAIELGEADAELAEALMAYVIKEVQTWHNNNPDSMSEKPNSRLAWGELVKTFGPFDQRLKSVEMNLGDDNTVITMEDGVLFELWAIACPELDELLSRVHAWKSSGSPEAMDDSSPGEDSDE